MPETAKELQRLHAHREQTLRVLDEANEALYRAVYQACEVEGASRRQVAMALGVGPTTVQGWVDRGRQLRGSPE